MPGLREAQAPLGDALLDVLMALAEAAPGTGRAFAGSLELLRDDPRDLALQTPHFSFSGDLRAGVLRQASREGVFPQAPHGGVFPHAPRGGDAALRHTGNLVEFRLGRHAACLDVEDSITDATIERDGDRVVLTHVSTIRGKAGLFAPALVEAGRLACRYEIRADSPVLKLEVRFTASRAVTQLRVTTALDAMEEEGLGAAAGALLSAGAWTEKVPPAAPGGAYWARGVPVAHLAVGAAGWPAGAPAAHLRPHDPARVVSVHADTRREGAVHWLLLRHGQVDLAAGETLVVREDRLLAPGEVGAVARMLAAGAPPGLDLDPAPDAGAPLRAVAAALLMDATGAWRERLTEARRAVLIGFAERQVARLAASEDAADLASALLGADALGRACGAVGPDELPALAARLVAALGAVPGSVTLGTRALAVLALARGAAWSDGAVAAAALPAVLERIGASAPGTAPALMLDGVPIDPLAEAEGVAVLARAVGAVVLAAGAGAMLAPEAVAKARELHRIAIALLRPLARPRDGRLEVQGPRGLAPGLQALVTLALLAPDRLILIPARTAA
jgi:hypothetical protein